MEAALSIRRSSEVLRGALALAGLLYLAACEEWHLSINSDGLVFISVTGDTGGPGHRFRLRTRHDDGVVRIVDVPASGQLELSPMASGTVELTLLTTEACRVAGANPRTVSVIGGEETRTGFDVRCA
jgi:hypothetical protein